MNHTLTPNKTNSVSNSLFSYHHLDFTQSRTVRQIQPISKDYTKRLPDHVYDCIRQAPKTALHLHTKGSTPILLFLLDQLLHQNNAVQPLLGEELETRLSIDGQNRYQKDNESGELQPAHTGLHVYRQAYSDLSNIAKTAEGALLTYFILLQELAGHHVRYVELRTGIPKDLSPQFFINTCQRACAESIRMLSKRRQPIDFGLILLINRSSEDAVERGIEIANTAVQLRQTPQTSQAVVAIDIAGDENLVPVTHFQPVFEIIHRYNDQLSEENNIENRKARIGITIHAGETELSSDGETTLNGYESVERSVLLGWNKNTPLRIGHGVRIVEHPAIAEAYKQYQTDPSILKNPAFKKDLFEKAPLLPLLIKRNIGLEVCPKSNYQTGAVESYQKHPAYFFQDLGLLVSINPDNMVISKTDPTNEYVKLFQAKLEKMSEKSGLPISEQFIEDQLPEFLSFMEATYRNGIRTSFLFSEEKKAEWIEEGGKLFSKLREKFLPPLSRFLEPLVIHDDQP